MSDAVADLFRKRNAQRLGLTVSDADRARDAEIDAFGERIGIAPMAAQQPMPGQPATSAKPAVPAGDTLSAMAPPGTSAAQPRAGIPALDALSRAHPPRDRGIRHTRGLGRVTKRGGM